MKTAIFASLIAGAAAFAPAQTGKASTALRAFEDEVSFLRQLLLGVVCKRSYSNYYVVDLRGVERAS
jgi:hypothetical protein